MMGPEAGHCFREVSIILLAANYFAWKTIWFASMYVHGVQLM